MGIFGGAVRDIRNVGIGVASAARQRFMRVRKRIGAEAYDIHALRHKRASELAAAGHDDATIMAITGHKSVAALRIYTEEARQKARAERTKNRT